MSHGKVTTAPNKSNRVGCRLLTACPMDSKVNNNGVHYSLPDIVAMRKCELVRILESMEQAVSKRQPTRLDLLGAVVTLPCDMGRIEL